MVPKTMIWLAVVTVLGIYTQLMIQGMVPELPIVTYLLIAVGFFGFIGMVVTHKNN